MTLERQPRIALLAAPETSASVLYGLYDVLSTVGPMWPDMTSAGSLPTLLEVSIVAASREPFRCYGNVLVEPHASVAELEGTDAVVVCDLYTPIGTPPRGRYTAEISFLRQMHASGTLVASVCSGTMLLAEAGLLDGRACAGHWAYTDLFREAYPQVRFDPGTILEIGHADEGIVTAGGVTSWQELALYLIARLCGTEQARRTAKVYLFGGHEDGQLPFASMSHRERVDDAAIRSSLDWIRADPGVPHPVAGMSARSGLTPRTFARRFRAVTGQRPLDYVHALRIERARELLEGGAAGIDEVGAAVGYEEPAFFRRLFRRVTGMTPAAYRRKFTAIVPATRSGPEL